MSRMSQTAQAPSRYAHMSKEQLIEALEKHDQTLQSIYQTIHLPNEKMAPGEKLFWIGARCVLTQEKPNEQGLVRMPTDKVAQFIGMSESSTGRYANTIIERYEATKESIPYTTMKGQSRTLTYVDRRDPLWQEPWTVDLPEEKARVINGNGKPCPRCKTNNLQVTTRRITYQEVQECECCGYTKVSKVLDDKEPLEPGEYIPEKKGLQAGEPFREETDFGNISNVEETEKAFQAGEPFSEKLENMEPLPPITPESPLAIGEYPTNGLSLEDWLNHRRGHGQIIYSTGILDQSKKYLHKPASYKPDIAAYLRGDLAHIYGSRPALPDGTTWLLGFDNEQPELDAQRLTWQQQLAAAGIPSVCWMRRPGRWHLEVYVDKAVDRKAFYAHLLNVCPGLAAIPECFPIGNDQNTDGVDRADFPYSWPLWYRVGNQVVECGAEVMFAGDTSPMVSTGIQSDKNRLTWLISQSIMDAALIPELPPCEEITQEAPAPGGGLLDTRLPGRQGNSCDDGLGKALIADFNAAYTWEEIVEVKDGRFRASWRNERTPSVVINADGTAHDFGKTGRYPSHFDKFEAYCLIKGLEKREELKRRIAAYQGREQIAS